MKKLRLTILFISVLIITPSVFCQTSYEDTIKPAFQEFTQQIAQTLPYLTTVGLSWNDAYIGGFPHFAAGLSVGFATIPYEAVYNLANSLGVGAEFDNIMGVFRNFGFPLPMWCIDGRLGGFILPFDLGIKFGFLPKEASVLMPEGVAFDYLMMGGEVRLALVEEPILDLSIGLAATYLAGGITVYNVTSAQTITFGSEWVSYSEGDIFFNWEAFSLDLKAQISKNLAFITISAGLGATYSLYAQTKGGFIAERTGQSTGFEALIANYPELQVLSSSFTVKGSANGWSLRAFGGVTFEILFLKLDLMAMYNFLGGTMGATLNLRLQL